jgi:general secretion pathway protein J
MNAVTLKPNMSGRQSGFTLLEMLVSLVVLGFLMVGLARRASGLTMWGAQARRVGETADLDAGARVLRRLLSGISLPPAGGIVLDASSAQKFEARPDSLTFAGDLPTGFGTTRRADITLEIDQGRLVLRWAPRRHELSTAPPPEPIETELIRRVERFDLAYWGSPSPDEPAGWQSQWDRRDKIPELIRVRLGFARDDRRHWPDLIAALQH